jgi:hypothetical protein
MQTLLTVEFMVTRAISRDSNGGIFEATCILTQCCLWLGSEVSRHLRLVQSINGFSFSLTLDQKRTINEQKSRHEVLGLKKEIKSMSVVLDQRLGRLASTMPSGSPAPAPSP